VAVAAVHRDVRVSDFLPGALEDPEVLAVAQKVVPAPDQSLDWKMELPFGRVEFLLRDGRKVARTGTDVPGGTQAPMTWDDIARKFEVCAAAAVTAPAPEQVRTAVRSVRDLHALDDATEVLRILAAPQAAATTTVAK
jgi:2-methylcitrate dehydratase PrpD